MSKMTFHTSYSAIVRNSQTSHIIPRNRDIKFNLTLKFQVTLEILMNNLIFKWRNWLLVSPKVTSVNYVHGVCVAKSDQTSPIYPYPH